MQLALQKQVNCVTACEMGLLRTKGIEAAWLFSLSSRRNTYLCL